jgi:hypothetical protein
MLIKTGDAEIIDVVDPDKVKDDDKRKDALAEAMALAKKRLAPPTAQNEEPEETER